MLIGRKQINESLILREDPAVAENEAVLRRAIVEGVLVYLDTSFRDLYCLESAFLETPLSDVPERVR